jgi:hypothetical protein
MRRDTGFLRLTAVVRGDRDAVTARVRDAFSEAGAWITDVHFFSGAHTVLAFDVAAEGVRALEAALAGAGVELDAQSRALLFAPPRAEGDVSGSLALIFAQGDLDVSHDVPAVPG